MPDVTAGVLRLTISDDGKTALLYTVYNSRLAAIAFVSTWEELCAEFLRQRNWRVAAPGEPIDGEAVWQADTMEGQLVVVRLHDGYVLSEVEGNFPIDYETKKTRTYNNAQDATEDAQRYLDYLNGEGDFFDPFEEA